MGKAGWGLFGVGVGAILSVAVMNSVSTQAVQTNQAVTYVESGVTYYSSPRYVHETRCYLVTEQAWFNGRLVRNVTREVCDVYHVPSYHHHH